MQFHICFQLILTAEDTCEKYKFWINRYEKKYTMALMTLFKITLLKVKKIYSNILKEKVICKGNINQLVSTCLYKIKDPIKITVCVKEKHDCFIRQIKLMKYPIADSIIQESCLQ